MTTPTILEVIQHYQHSIEKCQHDETRLLHCINKLYKLPVMVEHLQQTGIGKTVNSLRKFNGEISVASKTLVNKWKAMVAAEEVPIEANAQCPEEDVTTTNGVGPVTSDEEHHHHHNQYDPVAEKHSVRSSSSSKDKDKHRRHDETKEGTSSSKERQHKHRERDEKHGSSSTHKRKDRDGEKEKEKSDKERDHEKRKEKKRHKEEPSKGGDEKSGEVDKHEHHHKSREHRREHSSSKSKQKDGGSGSSSSRSKDKKHDRDREHRHNSSDSRPSTSAAAAAALENERKRRHNSDNEEAVDLPASKLQKLPKTPKAQPKEEVANDDGIDSSMGANFADVLGMLNVPSKKSKKSLATTIKSPTSSCSNGPTTSTTHSLKPRTAHEETRSSKENTYSSSSSISISTSVAASSRSRPDRVMASTSGKRSPDQKPELLSAAVKLEPLDPSIALALPSISTNYKPMPLNQTVMDCVFNNNSAPKAPVRTLTDTEAFSHGISSKTMRTKIYSGVRTGQVHQVPSLFDLCIRVLQKNIDALEYTGGVPFEVLRPVLERASPQQLLVFEEYNPYLMEDSDVLWQIHVQRTHRANKRQEMESWREMFWRCQEDQERKLNVLAETIKISQKKITDPIRKTQLAFVDSMVKPPRNVQRKQEQYGTKSKLIATPAARVAALSSLTPNAAKSGDARLRVAAAIRDPAQVSINPIRPKKAPLMAKTLQFMRGRLKR